MPDPQRIDPVLVEKVAKAIHEQWEAELFPAPADRDAWEAEVPSWRKRTERVADAAIRVVLDELGLKEEQRQGDDAQPMPPERRAEYQRRIEAASERHAIPIVHAGRPVGQGDTK